ncbi:MAG: hypothetical protein SH848_00075 [Saprospiraceae bacterium]|nr:hypothetical protein [Saprospiraceae bacterium]MDZ4702292.1 hypothetical protein [Saprospiraceae bacterium]
MTKSNTRFVLVILLAAASFASYLYLNSLKYENTSTRTAEPTAEEEMTENELNSPGKAILPDVYLLKKAVEAGKRLMPYQ